MKHHLRILFTLAAIMLFAGMIPTSNALAMPVAALAAPPPPVSDTPPEFDQVGINDQLTNENFDYGNTTGDLTTISGGNWVVHDAGGTTPNPVQYVTSGLTMPTYVSSGIGGSATFMRPGQDINRGFANQTSGTVYYAALISVSTASTSGDYFMHFRNNGFVYPGRLYAKDNGSGALLFGVATSSTPGPTYGATTFSYNTTYLAVIKHDIGTTVSTVYILETCVSDEPTTPLATATGTATTSILGVAIRQGGATSGVIGTVDGIRVGTTWADAVACVPLALTDLDLWQSVDELAWEAVPGSYAEGFTMFLDPAVEYYYLDTETITVNPTLADDYHPFFIDTYPAGFFDYWASRGVVDGATGWQGTMWQIINGDLPIFYLKVTGTDYMLVDGLTYQMGGGDTALKINGDYWPGTYTFSGEVTDVCGQTVEVAVEIAFVDPLALTDLDLWQSVDELAWEAVPGSYADGFTMALDPAVEYYYLDTNTLVVNRPLADGYHPFFVDTYPAGFFDYWAARGVVDGATGWQGFMWQIINGNQPIFYLLVNGTDYMLVDGLTYQMGGGDTALKINGTYWPGTYTFSGMVTDDFGFSDDVSVDITFVDPLALTDLDLWQSVDELAWEAVPGSYAAGFTMALDPTVEYYYLDTETIVVNRPLADGYYPFFVDTYPAGFFDYWASRGVVDGASGWQGFMWEIINGNQPIFYLLVNGTDYMLVDGLTYQMGGGNTALKINGTYWPGAYTFSGMVTDDFGFSDDVSVDITFNDLPVAEDQTVYTNEDTLVLITLTATDLYPGSLDWTVGNPAHGALTGTAPDLTYTPDADWFGTDTFTFTVNDGTLDSNIATVTIIVAPVNDAPVAQSQAVNTDEDTPVAITLVASDVDGDPLTWINGDPVHGTLTGTAPNLSYAPDADWFGTDTFTFTVNDGTLDSNIATVTIIVAPVNDAPVAEDQIVNTNEDIPVAITLVASDVDSDPLTWAVGYPTHGWLSGVAPDLTYIPETSNWFGTDTFTFTVNDGSVDSNIATVTIIVAPVNDAPIAESRTVNTDEDTSVAITLVANDAEGDPLTWTVGEPANGVLTGAAPALTYTPDADWVGTDTFTFTVNDGTLDSNIATVTITVAPINDAPVAEDQTVNTDEDTSVVITLVASDVDDYLLTWDVGDPAHGALTGTAPDLTYTPDADWIGTDTFTFTVNDGTLDSNIATVTIIVAPINDAPVAEDQTVNTDEDTPVAITLTADDVDGDPLTWINGDPAHGTLTGTAPNLSYAPDADWFGTDTFTFTVNDGTLDSNIATVTILVAPVNDAPVAVDDAYSMNANTALTVEAPGILENDIDIEDDPLTVVLVTDVAHGTLALEADGSFVYTPEVNFTGLVTFTYMANDGMYDSNIATVTIQVSGEFADLALSMTASADTVLTGDTITYVLTVTNHGPDEAIGVWLTDTLPAGVTLVSVTPSQGTCDEVAMRCDLGNLAADAQATVVIVVLAPDVPGTLVNQAAVGSTITDMDMENNSASAETVVNLWKPRILLPMLLRSTP